MKSCAGFCFSRRRISWEGRLGRDYLFFSGETGFYNSLRKNLGRAATAWKRLRLITDSGVVEEQGGVSASNGGEAICLEHSMSSGLRMLG